MRMGKTKVFDDCSLLCNNARRSVIIKMMIKPTTSKLTFCGVNPLAWVVQKLMPGAPRCVMNIIAMEAMERFSFYGFRAILTLYLIDRLGFSKAAAVSTYSFSSMVAYAAPVGGGWLADAKIGKFKTILWLGSLYCVGLWALVFSAAHASVVGSILSLLLVAVGTGGIKPCVSSFGADQFRSVADGEDDPIVRRYFAVFYGSINVGSVMSFVVVPTVKHAFGYAVAFALPAVLMVCAVLAFYAARHSYVKASPGADADDDKADVCETLRLVVVGPSGKKLSGSSSSEHDDDDDDDDEPTPTRVTTTTTWAQESASATESSSSSSSMQPQLQQRQGSSTTTPPGRGPEDDVKTLRRVLGILSTLPVFWMLYDQQGSVWVLQARDMHNFGGAIQPEQLGVVNPLCILALLPFFERVAYPWLDDVTRGGVTPPFRMALGMAFAAISFVVAAIIEAALPLNVLWQIPQIFLMSIGEILTSVTGLEFSYTSAPPHFKSTVTSAFLLTTAVGDLLGGVLYAAVGDLATRFALMLACAALMLLTLAFFAAVAKAITGEPLFRVGGLHGHRPSTPRGESHSVLVLREKTGDKPASSDSRAHDDIEDADGASTSLRKVSQQPERHASSSSSSASSLSSEGARLASTPASPHPHGNGQYNPVHTLAQRVTASSSL